jgi:hypothetical protein
VAVAVATAGAALAALPATGTPANGTLSVRVKHLRSDRLYIEGAVQFLVVKRSGQEIVRRRLDDRARVLLAVGRYWVSSYARPCDGNCGFLDPPRDRCSRYLTIRGGETRRATLRVRTGYRCSIRLERR